VRRIYLEDTKMNSNLQAMVAFALSKVGRGYIYGATGWISSRARREQQAAQYPEHAAMILGIGAKWDGTQCFDCAQLTRFAADAAGLKIPSGATSQWHSNNWIANGTLLGLPPEPCLVFRRANNVMQHVGIYVDDGWCVDARGTALGVVRTRFDSYAWTHYAMPDFTPAGSVHGLEPPFTARVKTNKGQGIGLWTDNTKTRRVAEVPEGGVVTVRGKPDNMGFALSEYNGKQGVGDTQYMVPLGTAPIHPPIDPPPWDGQEAWERIAASYALLIKATSMIADTLQDFGM